MPMNRCVPKINFVATQGANDEKDLFDACGTKDYRKMLDRQFKNNDFNFKIAVVVDMWITGFDVPSLAVMYIDKPLQKHTLVQTISRVNRVFDGKDMETRFMGLSRRLKSAYTICFPSGELTDAETAKAQFYLAIRSIIYKQTKGNAPDAEVMNRVVEEMVRNAIACTGIESIVDEDKSVELFSEEYLAELDAVKLPITKFNALLKLLRKAITSYGRTNKVKAQEFDERLRNVVDAYNSRDKLVFTSEVVDDKAQSADWSNRDDIKNQLNMELTVLLYTNGYPPEWDEEVFEKVMEQTM